MPKLIIQNLSGAAVDITSERHSVLYHLQQSAIDWMHACGGKGRCTTCKMTVLTENAHLSELTPAEMKFAQQGRLKLGERLACQCRVLEGEVVIEVPKAYQLPHVVYSS